MTEIWKPVPGYETLYHISDLGNIKRVADSRNGQKGGNILRPRLAKNGYWQISLSNGRQRWFHVHSLVCIAFHGPRPAGYVACHNDGVRANNTAANMRWDTRSNNEMDRVKHGTSNRGARHGMAKFSETQIRQVKQLLAEGKLSQRGISRLVGIAQQHISSIKRGKTWSHL